MTVTTQVGETMSYDDLTNAPDGTITRTPNGTRYHKDGGRWFNAHHNVVSANRIHNYGVMLDSLPITAETPVDNEHLLVETPIDASPLGVFRQKFYTVVTGRCASAGVRMGEVTPALMRLGLPRDRYPLTPGMHVHAYDRDLRGRMPDHTVVSPMRGVLIGIAAGNTHRLMGASNWTNTARVVSVPGNPEPPDWFTEPSTFTDLANWKAQAAEEARNVKSLTGWCGELEATVRAAGVETHDRSGGVQGGGESLTAEQVAALPAGSWFSVPTDDGVGLYVRIDSSPNPARTRRVMGAGQGHWAQQMTHHTPQPGQGMGVPVMSTVQMEGAPVGTRINMGGAPFVKCDDQRWMRGNTRQSIGTYRPRDFGFSNNDWFVEVPL